MNRIILTDLAGSSASKRPGSSVRIVGWNGSSFVMPPVWQQSVHAANSRAQSGIGSCPCQCAVPACRTTSVCSPGTVREKAYTFAASSASTVWKSPSVRESDASRSWMSRRYQRSSRSSCCSASHCLALRQPGSFGALSPPGPSLAALRPAEALPCRRPLHRGSAPCRGCPAGCTS